MARGPGCTPLNLLRAARRRTAAGLRHSSRLIRRAMDLQYRDIAKMLDHSLLLPTLSDAELEAGCALALAYDVASVCIVPHALRRCAELLAGSQVQASTTIGFPHGGHTTRSKLLEVE